MAHTLAVGNRTICWDEIGDPDGYVVFHFHGAGGSRLEAARLDRAAKDAGISIVALDRPGYGNTTDLVLTTPGDLAGDVTAVADSMGLDTFFVSGLSAGGMFALAVANRLGDRVTRAVTINGAPPITDPVIGAAAPKELRQRTKLAARFPGVVGWLMGRMIAKDGDDPAKAIARMRKASPADARLFERDPEALRLTTVAGREGRKQGMSSTARDFALAGSPWGFDVRSLSCEVVVVNGTEDPLRGAAEALAREVPGAHYVSVPGGHIAVMDTDVIPTLTEVMARGKVSAA